VLSVLIETVNNRYVCGYLNVNAYYLLMFKKTSVVLLFVSPAVV